MKKITLITMLTGALFVSACYVSMPEATDPAVQLENAQRYMDEGNPLAAERVIMESIRTSEVRNDPEGLGNAYRAFALFLRSPVLARRERTYRETGFLETSITYETRQSKSDEYVRRAIEQYTQAATRYQARGQYNRLATLYYRQAKTYQLINETKNACTAYEQSRSAYAESATRNQSDKPDIPSGFSSFHDAILSAKKRAGCS
ncbi:MAG: hypothetical protein LBK01_00130 [Burkholderiaceae bacterium]|jgi:hypothetical protein|nr:hypothetical protein [Burkholderiaceae bacterium]